MFRIISEVFLKLGPFQHVALVFFFRSDTHSAAWPGSEIQNKHQGSFPRIWPVSSRSGNRHHQRDAASLQVGKFVTAVSNTKGLSMKYLSQLIKRPVNQCIALKSITCQRDMTAFILVPWLWSVHSVSRCFRAKIGSRASICQEESPDFWTLPTWKTSLLKSKMCLTQSLWSQSWCRTM